MEWNQIPGWCDNEITDIYDMAVDQAQNGAVFVELGAFKGRSTSYLIDRIQDSGKLIQLYVIDMWAWDFDFEKHEEIEDADTLEQFKHFVGAERLALPFVNIVRSDSIQAANGFQDKQIDFIFFDTHHEYQHVVTELNQWLPKLKAGSIASGHDFGHPGVKQAVEEVFGDCETIESKKIHKIDLPHLKYEHFLTSWHTKVK